MKSLAQAQAQAQALALALALALTLPVTSFANETKKPPGTPIPIEMMGGEFAIQNAPLPVLVKVLERGYPYVVVVKESTADYLRNKSQQDLLDSIVAGAAANQKKTVEESVALSQWKRDLLEGRGEQVTATEEPIPDVPVVPVLEASAENRAAFIKCAARTLPVLKARLLSQRRGDTRAVLQLEALIVSERGDGTAVTTEGLACGKFLGKGGFPTTEALDDVKWLSAFLNTKEAARPATWRLFDLYSSAVKGEKLEAPHFWGYAWKRAAFDITFRGGTPPSLESLTAAYLAAFSAKVVGGGPPGTTRFVVNDEVKMKAAIAQDWKARESD